MTLAARLAMFRSAAVRVLMHDLLRLLFLRVLDYQIQGAASVGSFVSGRVAGDTTQFTTLIVGP